MIAVGVGMWPEPSEGFDLWLPVLVLLSFVLVRVVARLGITWRTSIAALAGAMVWSTTIESFGPLTASAIAVVAAFIGGEIVRRTDAAKRRREAR